MGFVHAADSCSGCSGVGLVLCGVRAYITPHGRSGPASRSAWQVPLLCGVILIVSLMPNANAKAEAEADVMANDFPLITLTLGLWNGQWPSCIQPHGGLCVLVYLGVPPSSLPPHPHPPSSGTAWQPKQTTPPPSLPPSLLPLPSSGDMWLWVRVVHVVTVVRQLPVVSPLYSPCGCGFLWFL
jgi:hypothetical protein